MDIEQLEDHTVVHFGNQMDNNTVVDQQVELLLVLQLRKPIHITANTLSKLDTAGIQLLVNFCRTAHIQGISLEWQAVSPALKNTAALLGAEQLLGLKEEHP